MSRWVRWKYNETPGQRWIIHPFLKNLEVSSWQCKNKTWPWSPSLPLYTSISRFNVVFDGKRFCAFVRHRLYTTDFSSIWENFTETSENRGKFGYFKCIIFKIFYLIHCFHINYFFKTCPALKISKYFNEMSPFSWCSALNFPCKNLMRTMLMF